jgi:YVTN family beta-propeller protein
MGMLMRKYLSILAALLCLYHSSLAQQVTLTPNSAFSTYKDPPPLYTIAVVNGAYHLVQVSFNQFGTDYKVTTGATVNIPIPQASIRTARPKVVFPSGGQGSTAIPPNGPGLNIPDPDEFGFDPWDIPDPPDPFTVPDTPSPFTDPPDPFGDPYGSLPEPPMDLPPLPGGDLPNSNFPNNSMSETDENNNDNHVNIINTGNTGLLELPRDEKPDFTSTSIVVGLDPAQVAYTPDGTLMFAASRAIGNISVISTASNTVVSTITLPPNAVPEGIAFTPDGAFAYVTNFDVVPNAVLYVINVAKRSLVTTIGPLNSLPERVRVTPDGTQAWVTSTLGNSVYIIDVLTNQVVTHIFNISGAWGIAFNPTGTRAYIASSGGVTGNITVIDTSSYQVLTTIPVGVSPQEVTVSPSGRYVFCTNYDSNFLSQIDARTNKLIRTITVGTSMGGLAFGK